MKAFKVREHHQLGIAVLLAAVAVIWMGVTSHKETETQRRIVSDVRPLIDECNKIGDVPISILLGNSLVWDVSNDSRSGAHNMLPRGGGKWGGGKWGGGKWGGGKWGGGKWGGGKWGGGKWGGGKWCQALKIDITPFLLLSSPHGKTS